MSLLSVYIHDDRYRVPTWMTVEIFLTEGAAFARDLVHSDTHYRRVELWLENDCVVSVTA